MRLLRTTTLITLCTASSLIANELNVEKITPQSVAAAHQPSRLSQAAHWASLGLAARTGIGSFAQMWQSPINCAITTGAGYPQSAPKTQLKDWVASSNSQKSVITQKDNILVNFLKELEALLNPTNTNRQIKLINLYKTSNHAIAQIVYDANYQQIFWAPLSCLTSPYSSQSMRTWRGASALVAAGLTYWLYRHPPQAPTEANPEAAPLSLSQKITKALSGAYVDQQTQTRTGLGMMLTGAMIAVGSYFILPKCSNLLLTPLPQTLSFGAIMTLRGIAIATNRP